MNALAVSSAPRACRARSSRIPTASPVAHVLAELDEMLTWPTNTAGRQYSKRAMILALREVAARAPEATDFQTVLSSVGNPDFSQYHREGVLSPTIIVAAPTLSGVVAAWAAYQSLWDLGGGNCPTIRVFRSGVEVAYLGYGERATTPFEWGNPARREINVETEEVA